ncbi:hypothetical protein HBI38_104750 [Parastagonospora nodorum]|nr:hypothetical protein HBH50_146490 [Parastagonospora nodorum]KAH4089320.1 hypothetical protein HBH48_111590 [Parastagonospora nodorum]KAH4212391.1 hypothetical protein HBI95_036710 [Parastagonospora nodorum]KAH4270435.1 hypothetical protein HBI03_043690 [Parastagonospora nodorum]KAH4278209.1 hypothetical protein HBI04_091060 [Parastagonospora nodorum]
MQASSGGTNPHGSNDPIIFELEQKLNTLAAEMSRLEIAALSGQYSPLPMWDLATMMQSTRYPLLMERYFDLQKSGRDRIEAALDRARSAKLFLGFMQTDIPNKPTKAPVAPTATHGPVSVATHAPDPVAKAAIPAQAQRANTHAPPSRGIPVVTFTSELIFATRPAAENLPGAPAQRLHENNTSQTPLQNRNVTPQNKDTPGKGKNPWLESREKAGLPVKFRAPSKGGKIDPRLITIGWSRFQSYAALPRTMPIMQNGQPVKDRDGNDRVAKIMNPADYGGNTYYDLGLCEAWFLHGDCVDWGLCPCRHWFFDATERRWVLDAFLTKMSGTFEGPWLPPDDDASGYVGIPREYISGRVFEPEH